MRLQYLGDRRDVVHAILRRWAFDGDRLDLLDRHRIGANAVYPFLRDGQLHFLRFAPLAEKRDGQVEAEIAWLDALHARGMVVSTPVPSLAGKRVEHVATDWGLCTACVFTGVAGHRLDCMDWNPLPEAALRAAGKLLGELHRIAEEARTMATCTASPWTWQDALAWSEKIVIGLPFLPEGALGVDDHGEPWPAHPTDPDRFRHVVQTLRETLSSQPDGPQVYGLIHYDFETDNLFWQSQASRCVPIDFDDCMLHWFGMDLFNALGSLRDTLADKREEAEQASRSVDWERLTQRAEQCFLDGYVAVRPVPEALVRMQPVFRRFNDVLGYARAVHAVQQVDPDEPAWMTDRRILMRHFVNERMAALRSD